MAAKPVDVSEMSGSLLSPLTNGPETRYVIDAIDALLRSDVVAARLALIDGADATSWAAVAHRLDVAGHALAVDAGWVTGHDVVDDTIVVLPGLDTSSWSPGHDDDVKGLVGRWSNGVDAELSIDRVWSLLNVVTWLVERAGFPAEVVF